MSNELSGNVVGDQPIVEEIPEDGLDSGSEVAVTSGVIDLDSVELIGARRSTRKEVVDLTKGYGPTLVDLTSDEFLSPPAASSSRSGYRRKSLRNSGAKPVQCNLHCEAPSSSTALSPAKKIVCPVCMDDSTQLTRSGRHLVSTICGHVFCDNCILQAVRMQRKCPTCRKKLTSKQFHPIYI